MYVDWIHPTCLQVIFKFGLKAGLMSPYTYQVLISFGLKYPLYATYLRAKSSIYLMMHSQPIVPKYMFDMMYSTTNGQCFEQREMYSYLH